MNCKGNLYFCLLLFILMQSCVNLRKASYFKSVDSKELVYVPREETYFAVFPKFAYLEKDILDSQSNKVGEFIIKAYENSNERILLSGIIIPLFPLVDNDKPERGGYHILELGFDFYDTCQIFNNLNKKSFVLQVNNNENDIINCSTMYKNKRDCQMKAKEKTKIVKCSITYFFKSNSSIEGIISLKLIPVDSSAKTIISPTIFKKKKKLHLEYIFGPR